MKAPRVASIDQVKARILGQSQYYPVESQVRGYAAYSDFIRRLTTNYRHLFQADLRGRTILAEAESLNMLIVTDNPTVATLDKLFAAIELIKGEILSYIKQLKAVDNIKLAIQSEVVSGFKNATQPGQFAFLQSAPKKLYQAISRANTPEEVSAAWLSFKQEITAPENTLLAKSFRISPAGFTHIALDQKLAEIDAMFKDHDRRVEGSEALLQLTEIIDAIAAKIECHDATMHQIDEQKKAHASTHETLRQYTAHKICPHQRITVTDESSRDVLLTLEHTTASGRTLVKQIRIVAPHNEHPINNQDSFSQHLFSQITLFKIFADMQAQDEHESAINNGTTTAGANVMPSSSTSDQITALPDIKMPRSSWLHTISNYIGDSWRKLTAPFSIVRLRHNPLVAAGFVLFLGLVGHSGKVPNKVASENTPVPVTTLAVPVAPTLSAIPMHIDSVPTTADSIPNQTVTRRASTSEGSRYGIGSHNHNTDETLQRMVKAMGFNSVQTKVIATRLDGLLRAARDIQAPGTHTQANQNVMMEELNGQVRLSVQNANGGTLYQTGWFAREIGFRNFQPRA